jgi:hypothetical protein
MNIPPAFMAELLDHLHELATVYSLDHGDDDPLVLKTTELCVAAYEFLPESLHGHYAPALREAELVARQTEIDMERAVMGVKREDVD